MDRLPSKMSLAELQCRCWGEMKKFSRQEPNDESFCLEIFRRALELRDEQAWEILTETISAIILGWLRRHPCREEAYRLHTEEDYVALTIERLWMVTVRNQTLQFRSLPGAFAFLRVSLNSVIIDTLRNQGKDLSIGEIGSMEPTAPLEEESDEIWECIKSMLPDQREQRLAYLLFHCNLKPRQIVQFCSQEFCNVQEIFHMKRSILDRLKRRKDVLYHWLLE